MHGAPLPPSDSGVPRRRLLVAEDDIETRALLRKTLAREGFEVEVAANGREALALLQAREFDLVISDVRMPEKDGEQLLDEALRLRPSLKVVVITGYSEFEQYRKMLTKGAFDCVAKPFKIPDLIEVIDRALAPAVE